MSEEVDMVVALPFAIVNGIADSLVNAYMASYERAEARFNEQVQQREAHDGEEAALLALAGQTRVASGEDVNEAFLLNGIAQVIERLRSSADSAETREACEALRDAVHAEPDRMAEHLSRYYALVHAASQLSSSTTQFESAEAQACAVDAMSIEALLASPLVTAMDAGARTTCDEQFVQLRALATDHPDVAAQGLAQLRRRVEREMQQAAAQTNERRQTAAAVRDALAVAIPQLQTVVSQAPNADDRAQAMKLLEALSTTLASPSRDMAAEMQTFARDAEALFMRGKDALTQQAQAQAVQQEVSDVLLTMGYRVSQASGNVESGDRRIVMALDGALGVEFHVGADGRVTSEAVAFAPNAAKLDAATEARVCALVDTVIGHLRERNCTVRERRRKTFKFTSTLRVAEPPTTAHAPQSATQPQQVRRDVL